jgi:predicted transcriptional regulator
MKKNKTFNMTLDHDLRDKADKIIGRKKISLSALINMAVADYTERDERERAASV